MKYRIKEYEALVTRYSGGQWAKEAIETVYQIQMREKGFWGFMWGWSNIGSIFDTEEQARKRIADYKIAESQKIEPQKEPRYINID